MKQIYLDSEFKCHVQNDGTMESIETDYFDGKCDTYIEGYRFVPAGKSWTRWDGVIFEGEMISPAVPYEQIERAQGECDKIVDGLSDAYQTGVDSI